MEKNRKLIAIVGPSASGKTTLANQLTKRLGQEKTIIISLDQYYRDWSRLPFSQREKINFDAPSSFDFSLLRKQLIDLNNNKAILAPYYSYRLHKRLKKRIIMNPKNWIIVEGLLLFCKKPIRDLFDLKIYINSDIKTSLARRLSRDLKHRGETVESVRKRYFEDVLPMQKKYVEPQKRLADVIINGNKDGKIALKRLIQRCRKLKN